MRNYLLGNEPWTEAGLLGRQDPVPALLPELRDLSPSGHPFTGSGSSPDAAANLNQPILVVSEYRLPFVAPADDVVTRTFTLADVWSDASTVRSPHKSVSLVGK